MQIGDLLIVALPSLNLINIVAAIVPLIKGLEYAYFVEWIFAMECSRPIYWLNHFSIAYST